MGLVNRFRPRLRHVAPEVRAAVVVAALIRILFRLETAGDPLFRILVTDAKSYFDLGRRFAAGDPLFGTEALWFAPFYPILTGTVFSLFGPEVDVVRVLQHVVGVATAGLAADLARRLAPGAGWVAGLLVAASPVLIFFESQLLYTSWAVFLTALFLDRLVAGVTRGTSRSAAGSGLLLGLLGWVRSNALLFLPVGVVVWARRGRPRVAAWFLAAGLAALLPILLRNGLLAGVWSPLTVNGGLILAESFRETSLGGRARATAPEDFGPHGLLHREAERRAGRTLSLAEASDLQRRWALERMRQRPGRVAILALRKLDLLFDVREMDDNLGFETVRDRSRVLRMLPGPWAWVLVPGLVGAMIAFRRPVPGARLLVLWIAVYAVSLLVFFVTSRYRLPLLVPLAALAGFGTAETVRATREGRTRLVAVAGLVALATIGLSVVHDPGVRPSETTRLVAVGAALQDAGYPAEALELTERAIRAGDESAAAYQNRALILLTLARPEEALRSVQVALRRAPDVATAWNTRGTILARLGRMEEAVPSFRRAVELDPDDAMARENLDRALAGLAERGTPAAAAESPPLRGADRPQTPTSGKQ